LGELIEDDFQWPLLDVIVVVILSPTIMMIFVYILWRVRAQQRRKKELAPVQVVDNLPTKIFYKEKRKENEPEECVICIEDFVDEDELRVLPCKHEFHIPCIDSWLTTRKKFCPICKRDVCPLDPEAVVAPNEQTPLLRDDNASPVPVASGANNMAPAAASSSS
jgi:E3 ubiquitin-protein ligase RNF13